MFAAALSEHPDVWQATAEVIGQVLEANGGWDKPPDLAMLFVTPPHRTVMAEIAGAVRASLHPVTLLGCTAESVVGGAREVERTPAVSLWAGHTGPVTPFHLSAVPGPDGPVISGWPEFPAATAGAIVIADPFTFPADALLEQLQRDHPGVLLIGGMALADRTPGENRLVLDEQTVRAGAVGAVLGPDVTIRTVVSQGCRPVGQPLVVTKSEGNVVYELAGRSPLERLGELAEAMPEAERPMLYRGVHLGRVIDEHKLEFGRGDFLIRNVLGGDPNTGAIQVGDRIEVGATAQFQVRDAEAADEDLRHLVHGQVADGALLFTCNGRGKGLFGVADHDARVISEGLDGVPLAGMFCAGEIGPVGGRNFLHGFTASIALLTAANGG